MHAPLIILCVVLFLVVFRRFCGLDLRIWQSMFLGALACLLTGQVKPVEALASIDLDIMFFLFCVFFLGRALEESGYLSMLSYRLFRGAKSVDELILSVLFFMGAFSAFLMNDTLAIIGTPIVLMLAKEHDLDPKLLLLTLCFAVTTGSVLSPIGNPQNLLIAFDAGFKDPFSSFFTPLLIPTAINMFLAYLFLRFFYSEGFEWRVLAHKEGEIRDLRLARLCKASLFILFLLVSFNVSCAFLDLGHSVDLRYVAAGAICPLLLHRRRIGIIRGIDWATLVFFASMFVLMGCVESSLPEGIAGYAAGSLGSLLFLSAALSQVVSNVPAVMLFLPFLEGADKGAFIALAAGSTIAGNLSIIGAASNVIVAHNAEKMGEVLGFFEFARVGVPLTVMQLCVYWLFLSW